MVTLHIEVINLEVRRALKNNCDHPFVSECWARPRRIAIVADDLESALERARERYRSEDGFVLRQISSEAR